MKMTGEEFEMMIVNVLEFKWLNTKNDISEVNSWIEVINRIETLKLTTAELNLNYEQFDDLKILWMIALERVLSASKMTYETPAIFQPQNT